MPQEGPITPEEQEAHDRAEFDAQHAHLRHLTPKMLETLFEQFVARKRRYEVVLDAGAARVEASEQAVADNMMASRKVIDVAVNKINDDLALKGQAILDESAETMEKLRAK